MVFQQLGGINAVIFYASEIFEAAGEKLQLALGFHFNLKNVPLIL